MKILSSGEQLRMRTRRGFLTLGAGAVGATAFWSLLRSRRLDDGMPYPFRRVLDWNESLSRKYFSRSRRAREFPAASAAAEPRENGSLGLDDDDFVVEDWRLSIQDCSGRPARVLKLSDLQELPKVEQITQLNCIEGWTEIVHWGGARFTDFCAAYASGWVDHPYVRMETPDREYYVGLDMASAMHPQTLLCYEINAKPLTRAHGAPLRLVIPVKYGIKSIKRIGSITFHDSRPEDYWAKEGYDWYAGL